MSDTAIAAPNAQETYEPAGFWIRLLADIVDSFIVVIPATIAASLLSVVGASRLNVFFLSKTITLAVGAAYYTILTGGPGQATWGKRIFDLKVVNDDGSPLGTDKAFMRWCAYLPSYLTLCFGFMMAGWNKEKKALHDFIVGTRVVRRSSADNTAWKVVAAIAGTGVVLVGLLVGGGVLWLKQNAGQLREQGKQVEAEGKTFGAKSTQDACVAEAVSRLNGASILGEVRNRMFLKGCLASASPSAGLCENVPSKKTILPTVLWRIRECEALGRHNDQPCGRLMEEIQNHCADMSAAAPAASAAAAPAPADAPTH